MAIGRVVQAGLQKYPDPLATAFRIRGGRAAGRRSRLDPLRQRQRRAPDDDHAGVRRLGRRHPLRQPRLHPLPDARRDSGRGVRRREFQRRLVAAATRSPSRSIGCGWRSWPIRTARRARCVPPAAGRRSWPPPCPARCVVDEAYVDFADTNCLALVRENEKILVTRSLSKSYALAGLRFGYVVAQPQVIEQLRKVKDSYNCDALSIAGATAAIDDQAWLAETRAAILATRERMTAALRELGFASVAVAGQLRLESAPERAGRAALSAAQSERRPGPLHELRRLGRRPADQRRHRRTSRRLPGAC